MPEQTAPAAQDPDSPTDTAVVDEVATDTPRSASPSWWRGLVQSIVGGVVAGVAASLILDAFGAYRQSQRDQMVYDAIKANLAESAEAFRKQTLRFAGHDGRFARNNIYQVPTFPFALFEAVERNEPIFIEREGEDFIRVLASVGAMQEAYEEIVARRSGGRSAGDLSWGTSTWNRYFRPSCEVCAWAGVKIDDIEPADGY